MPNAYEFDTVALLQSHEYAKTQVTQWETFLKKHLPPDLPFNYVQLYSEWYHEQERTRKQREESPL